VSANPARVVRLGEVSGVHGVRGWIKLLSFTDPRTNIFDYPNWLLDLAAGQRSFALEAGTESGRRLIAKLAGIDDRDAAESLVGAPISVPRAALPACAPGEYYWADLVGLAVESPRGLRLGSVERLIATGANDVLVLAGDGERMIPFIQGEVVLEVDIDNGRIVVDWDLSYWD
jgi:16S rRNA processing protein RimM